VHLKQVYLLDLKPSEALLYFACRAFGQTLLGLGGNVDPFPRTFDRFLQYGYLLRETDDPSPEPDHRDHEVRASQSPARMASGWVAPACCTPGHSCRCDPESQSHTLPSPRPPSASPSGLTNALRVSSNAVFAFIFCGLNLGNAHKGNGHKFDKE